MNIPRIGVGILVIQNDKLLLGKRQNSHGDQTWAPPGGHLEFGETPIECAARELMEETGMSAHTYFVGPYTHDVFTKENKHYITLYIIAGDPQGNPILREPEKCTEWKWVGFDELPQPLFLSLSNLLITGFSLKDIKALQTDQSSCVLHRLNFSTHYSDNNLL